MYQKSSWTFNKEVSEKFDHHVRQSVPFYDLIQTSITYLSDYFVSPGALIYDLGCATGESIHLLEQRHPSKNLRYIGIDESKDMLLQAKLKNEYNDRAIFEHLSLENLVFKEKSRLIISILTLQFLPIEQRKKLIHNIYECLHEGGAVMLVEKTYATTSIFQDLFTHIHYEMKVASGLSHKDVLQKEDSLRGVMTPLSTQSNIEMLQSVGFSVEIFMKHWQFTGFLAIKPISKKIKQN